VFCKNCGTELPEDSQFCRKCGQALGTVAVSSSGAAAASAPTHVDKPKPKLARSPFVVAGVLVLVLLIYGYNASQKANPNRDANPIEKLTKALHTEDLSKSALLVNAAGFAYFKLDVRPEFRLCGSKATLLRTAGRGTMWKFTCSQRMIM